MRNSIKTLATITLPLLFLVSVTACGNTKKETSKLPTTTESERTALTENRTDMQSVGKVDPVMNTAIAEAKKSLPDFIAKLDASKGGLPDATFKYPLAGWEHIWVNDVKHEGDFLIGTLANQPAEPGYKIGDPVRVAIKDVSDWGYRDPAGKMQGHYTTRVLLTQIDPQEAASIKESFGW